MSSPLPAAAGTRNWRVRTTAGTRAFYDFTKNPAMPAESLSQRKTTGRVMHELKHGELKSGPSGKGGKVKSRKQAIAIARNSGTPPAS
jgi:hypothetical protein